MSDGVWQKWLEGNFASGGDGSGSGMVTMITMCRDYNATLSIATLRSDGTAGALKLDPAIGTLFPSNQAAPTDLSAPGTLFEIVIPTAQANPA